MYNKKSKANDDDNVHSASIVVSFHLKTTFHVFVNNLCVIAILCLQLLEPSN